jgi:hypothetical protein
MATRSLLAVVIAVMAGAVVAGIFVLGSPATQRERRLDQRRVEDLGDIANTIELYYLQHKRLPQALDADGPEYRRVPRDPATTQPYEYRVIDAERYEVCAVFQQPLEEGSVFWRHGVGRQCFTRRARMQTP